ncbi:hypothetical protein [Tortoise microvirus 14]|nr:hypothetical protein [Tortoise microvirus 14]
MITKIIRNKNKLFINKSYEGESIEEKCARVTQNKEPIKDAAPIIYQERKEGVLPGYDIRTDRFEIAIEAMDKVARSKEAKREEIGKKEEKSESPESLRGKDIGESTVGKN